MKDDDKVLVDTSVWIDYFKGQSDYIATLIDAIITENNIYVPKVVIAELIQGCKSEKELSIIEDFLDAFFIIDSSENTWINAGNLSFLMKKRGKTVNLIDCYIAVIANENDCKILTLDKHFNEIKNFLKIRVDGICNR
ncbi:MAG: PIN domain nuclease [Candidatus Acididesulfobacter guangdongensis]|uniref:Ribonuclease VapC n=1 Tax=Acididesulfobacter guangdongensis TaxID=2597225 RepID=A0A519BFG4_ACIG2|nr:MAG: PIN domain nuclease [Candidatus Acididesulfobacter guangdongensis]